MKLWKRICAVVLVIALVVTGLQYGGITSNASDVTYTDMSITGLWRAPEIKDGHWRVYVTTSKEIPWTLSATTTITGLTVETNLAGSNGTTVSNNPDAGKKTLMLDLWGTSVDNVQDGDYITIKAGQATCSADTTLGIQVKYDFTLVYSNGAWGVKTDYTEVNITGHTADPSYHTDGQWRVNLTTDATLPAEGIFTGLSVQKDGTAIGAYGFNNGGNLLLVMEGWTDNSIPADGTIITLSAGYATSAENACAGIYIPMQYALVYDVDANDGNGGWIEPTYTEMNITGLWRQPVANSEHMRVDLTTSATVSNATGMTTFTGLTIESFIAGASKGRMDVHNDVNVGSNSLFLNAWDWLTTDILQDGDYITIKAGKATCSQDTTLGIQVKYDFTLVYSNGAWGVKTDYTEVNITGHTADPSYHTDGQWRVNLTTDATLPAEGIFTGLSVQKDGTAIGAYGFNNGGNLLLVMEGWTDNSIPADGTIITLSAGYATSAENACAGIYIPMQYALVYDVDANDGNGGWIEPTYTEMNITGLWRQPVANSEHMRVDLTTSATVSNATGMTTFTGLTIESFIAGASKGRMDVHNDVNVGSSSLFLNAWNWLTTDIPQDGDYITIKAGKAVCQDDTSVGIYINQDYTLVYNGTVGAWEAYVDTQYSDITAENLSLTSWYRDGNSYHWRLDATVSGTFPSTDNTTGHYSAPVYLNDELFDPANEDGVQVYKKNNNTIGLLMWKYRVEKPNDGTKVTVPKGQYRDEGDATVGINITEDINFVWDADANEWYLDIVPEESNTFALDTSYANGGDGEHIYLTSNDEREEVSNSANITAVKTGIVSGIFYNGEATKGYLRMNQYGEDSTRYCVMLGDAGINAVRGDLVTVQGCFGYNNYVVDYEPITLLYDGTQWNTCYTLTPVTATQGGLNFNLVDAKGNPVETELTYGDWNARYSFVQGGMYYNDKLITTKYNGIDKLLVNTYYASTDMTTSWVVGDKLVLDGIIMDSIDTTKRIAIKFERTTWVYGDEGWKIDSTVVETYDKTVSLTVDTEFASVDETTVTIVMQPSKGILGEPELATWNGLDITAIDSEGNVTYLGQPTMAKTDRGMLQFTLNKSDLPDGEYTIAVKMGLLSPVDTGLETDETIYPVYNMKDSYIYVNDYGIGYRKHVVRGNSGEADEALTLDNTNSTSTAVKWTVATTSLTSNVAMSATDIDSGVFINGKRYEDATVTKTTDTTLQVNLSGVYTPVSGDHLLVVGTFACEEEFIVIAPAAATYDGSSWRTADNECTTKITLNIYDDEYVIEGTNVAVKDSEGAVVNKKVLYQAGDYTVTRTIGEVVFTYNVSLYRPNDLNQNNTYDAVDLVKRLKYDKTDDYKNTLSEAEQLAAEEGSVVDVRGFILGRTKADAALPTKMIGATTNKTHSKYITSVSGTTNGTTVIGMSDANADYEPETNIYDDYGFDYVLDFDVTEDRELRILQLSDTQIIDGTQVRYDSRLGQSSKELWDGTAEVRQRILFNCIEATVKEAQPDLILIAGDIIFGEFDDNGENLKALVAHMEQYQIPWAPVYGNHDNESYMGVAWQNAQFADATYCLYYSGHDIGGNSNYSIGLAKNGTLQRAVYMMDTNFCANVKVYQDGVLQTDVKHINQDGDETNGEILTQLGFTDAQHEWYRTTALRTNAIIGDKIPSMLCYHVPTIDVWLGTKAACYQEGYVDKNTIQYTIGEGNIAQSGDSGFKRGNMLSHNSYKDTGLLDIMLEVGGDSASFGHEHNCSVSTSYGGVRWTFGLKTGAYDSSPTEQGGTLFTISPDGSEIAVNHIVVTGTTIE